MNANDTLDLIGSAIENALYELAQEQTMEGNEDFLDYFISRSSGEVYISLDSGLAVTIALTVSD